MKKGLTRCILAFGALATPACHTFVAVAPEAVEPGSSVRVTLEREEVVRQVETLGSLEPVIAGRVGDRTGQDILGLSVRSHGVGESGLFDAYLEVPWTSVQLVEESRFSWVRTGGLAAVGAAIAVGILSTNNESARGEPPGPGPDNIPIPLFRIVW